MKAIIQEGNIFIIRFDPEEDIIEGLRSYCATEGITAGVFQAIGTVNEIIVSFFDLQKKQYEDHQIQEALEIACLNGNISTNGDQIIVHAHGSFADRRMQLGGGHVKRAVVSATAEVVIRALEGELIRHFSPQLGLDLLGDFSTPEEQ
jgi:hypothetical protein